MAKARNISPERKALLKQFIKEFDLTDTDSNQDAMKDILGDTIQELLKVEMDEHFSYSKYDYRNRDEDSIRRTSATDIHRRPSYHLRARSLSMYPRTVKGPLSLR